MSGRNNKPFPKLIVIVAVAFIAFTVFSTMTFVKVDSGNVGIITHFGAVQDELLPEGLHMVNPFKTTVIEINTRIQKIEATATASSKDLQPVSSRVALNYFLSKQKANLIYQDLGLKYESTIIQPIIQESIKSATARYTAEELITKRPMVKKDVFEYIKKRLEKNNIVVTDFSIVNFDFSNEFNKAIERKQVAEQKALTAVNDLERIKTEAEQERIRAEAQADAQKLLQQSLDDKLLRLKAIEKWDGVMPVVIGNEDGNFVDVSTILKRKK